MCQVAARLARKLTNLHHIKLHIPPPPPTDLVSNRFHFDLSEESSKVTPRVVSALRQLRPAQNLHEATLDNTFSLTSLCVSQALVLLPQLQKLSLFKCPFTVADMEHMGSKLTGLTELVMVHPEVGDCGDMVAQSSGVLLPNLEIFTYCGTRKYIAC
jgi:hypothetical protein